MTQPNDIEFMCAIFTVCNNMYIYNTNQDISMIGLAVSSPDRVFERVINQFN